jgi:hypothetical protein
MKIIARIPAVAADEARLTVLVPMPESAWVPEPEPQPEVSEPEVSEPVPVGESAEPAARHADTSRSGSAAKPLSQFKNKSQPKPGPKSKSKSTSKSKPKSEPASWTLGFSKSPRLKVASFPALSSVLLVLLAAAVWCLAAWNDMERIERHSLAARLARMPAADGSPPERVLR